MQQAAMGLHIEFISVSWQNASFPKASQSCDLHFNCYCIYILIRNSTALRLNHSDLVDGPLFLPFLHPLSLLSITFLFLFTLFAYRFILSCALLPIPSLFGPDEYTDMKGYD